MAAEHCVIMFLRLPYPLLADEHMSMAMRSLRRLGKDILLFPWFSGDRIRGALWLLRVAITYKKILLVDWTKPAPLTDFLVPNEIDWTFSGLDEMLFRNGSSTLSTDDFNDAVYRQVPTALEKFLSTKVYTTNSNQHFDTRDMVGVQPVDRLYEDGSCFFKFLFKPHPLIAARGDAHLQQLYGSESVDYVAWHWRHFDADGMSEKGIMASELSRVLSCAEGMARKVDVDLDQRPMLLVTDFNVFRQMVANRELRRLITPNIVARHIDLGQHAHDELVDIFVDLYLLSRVATVSNGILTGRDNI
ncbi:hypothetical protein VOLCADRAFT_97869 [Volvox carteri f. nagariensis]|uniref:O-fucosyltransferase family protein n=1 Tax=Volvox carteri f. nagariensis TaxID=3068 RepID=D8UDV3_VOLCA|nr:uncharacterized protein VOLCADRAFT_97869 [Volvox carteri f. nagariensis]EFJ42111.1 hypothetical protein VOLCADRAFT_97869 [Volvox carteri f. nagariensis]|eukprot:XP_002956808.1 hypothetical protein VOLCADRAFT_97869 [Volvox carteri f. nagariensis]